MDQPTINPPAGGVGNQPAGGQAGKLAGEPTPFEMPPNLAPSEPMGGKVPQGQGGYTNTTPINSPPPGASASPGSPRPMNSFIIMIVLVVVLIAGGVLFADWKGWISVGIFGGTKPTPPITTSPKVSVAPLPTISPVTSSSPVTISNINDEARREDLASIKSTLDKYFLANSKYPQSMTVSKSSDKTGVLYSALVPIYAETLPDDPLAPQYYYGYKSDGATFEVTCVLEDKSDTSGTLVNSMNIYKVTNITVE